MPREGIKVTKGGKEGNVESKVSDKGRGREGRDRRARVRVSVKEKGGGRQKIEGLG